MLVAGAIATLVAVANLPSTVRAAQPDRLTRSLSPWPDSSFSVNNNNTSLRAYSALSALTLPPAPECPPCNPFNCVLPAFTCLNNGTRSFDVSVQSTVTHMRRWIQRPATPLMGNVPVQLGSVARTAPSHVSCRGSWYLHTLTDFILQCAARWPMVETDIPDKATSASAIRGGEDSIAMVRVLLSRS